METAYTQEVTTKEQIAGMKKVQTDLQGKLRAAQTEEEKADLQERNDNTTQNISDKVKGMMCRLFLTTVKTADCSYDRRP